LPLNERAVKNLLNHSRRPSPETHIPTVKRTHRNIRHPQATIRKQSSDNPATPFPPPTQQPNNNRVRHLNPACRRYRQLPPTHSYYCFFKNKEEEKT
jgi:hypothetical protein